MTMSSSPKRLSQSLWSLTLTIPFCNLPPGLWWHHTSLVLLSFPSESLCLFPLPFSFFMMKSFHKGLSSALFFSSLLSSQTQSFTLTSAANNFGPVIFVSVFWAVPASSSKPGTHPHRPLLVLMLLPGCWPGSHSQPLCPRGSFPLTQTLQLTSLYLSFLYGLRPCALDLSWKAKKRWPQSLWIVQTLFSPHIYQLI